MTVLVPTPATAAISVSSCRAISCPMPALVDKGVLAGVGDGKLDLSMDMLRTMLITQEMVDAQEKEGKA